MSKTLVARTVVQFLQIQSDGGEVWVNSKELASELPSAVAQSLSTAYYERDAAKAQLCMHNSISVADYRVEERA